MTKTCTNCGIEKDLSEFPMHYDNRTGKTSPRAHCKICHNKENDKYAKEHPEVGVRKVRKYEKLHPEKVGIARRKRFNARYDTEPNFKLVTNIRNRQRKALDGIKKTASTKDLLGCTPQEFRDYMESKFYPNPRTGEPMTWKNKGVRGWHDDHIIPIDSFDLDDPEQQRECFHYTNHQPLWWFENLEKGNKVK